MTTRAADKINYSTFPVSDGEPMAETFANQIQMLDLEFALQTLFDLQERGARTVVGGNQLMYYNARDGRDHVSPDVYVAFDRRPPAPPSWRTWVEGKFPDIVWEITSPSTQEADLSAKPDGKRRLYADLGVREYYIYDPQQAVDPPFAGYESRAGRMESLSLLPSGGIMSPLLKTELRPMMMEETSRRPGGMWLRVIDPQSGRPLPTSEEVQHHLATLQRDFAALQERLARDDQARVAAEQRAAQADAAFDADAKRDEDQETTSG